MVKVNLDQQKQQPVASASVTFTEADATGCCFCWEIFSQIFDPTENIYSDFTG